MARADKNLHALSKHHPELFEGLKNSRGNPRLFFQKSRSGLPIARVQTKKGDVFLHSRFDPLREAGRLIDSHNIKTTVIIVYGFACAYHIKEILRRCHEKSLVIVIDPDLSSFRSVIEEIDLVQLFADPRLKLFIGVPPSQLARKLDPYLLSIFMGSCVIAHEASDKAAEGRFIPLRKAMKNFIEYGTTSLYTAASISAQSRFNTYMNLPHAVFNPGVGPLKNLTPGCAAIVIGAGPSLFKNIALLRKAPVIKIATGTILKKLLAEDIVPHFVCNIDYHFKLTKKYFQDLPPLPHTMLVTDARANYGAADTYPGPVCTWDDPFTEKFLKGFRKKAHGTLAPAATVAQTCFYLAQYLGCDPIVTVGLDLSYPGHITHIPGTAILDNWHSETNRFFSVENKEWEYFARYRKTLVRVEDVEGRNIYTDRQMFTYIQLFNRLFTEAKQKIIDASEQGARKEGAVVMSLEKALQEPFQALEQDFNGHLQGNWQDLSRQNDIVSFLDTKIENCEQLIELYQKLIDHLELIDKHLDANDLPVLMNQLENIRKQLAVHVDLTNLVNELTQADDYRRQRDDQEIILGNYEGITLKRKQLQRDLQFTRGLQGGARFLTEFIRQARLRCAAWPEKHPENFIPELEMIKMKIMKSSEKKEDLLPKEEPRESC
jgi:hypothetical protein